MELQDILHSDHPIASIDNLARTADYLNYYVSSMKGEVGVKENRVGGVYNNHGIRVDEYQRVAGYPNGGLSWCCCFQYWNNYQAAKHFDMPSVPMIKTGSCQVVQDWARSEGILIEPFNGAGNVPLWPLLPNRPMLVLVVANGTKLQNKVQVVQRNPHAHHIAGMYSWSGAKRVEGSKFYDIEGNTNMDGSSNGYEVADRYRLLSGNYRFVDIGKMAAREFEKMFPAKPEDSVWSLVSKSDPSKRIMSIIVDNGTSWAGVREWGRMFNMEVKWIPMYQNVKLGGSMFDGELTMHDDPTNNPPGPVAFAKVRDLARVSGLDIIPTPQAKTVMVARR